MRPEKLLIFVPTYNESENVRQLIERLNALPLSFDLLFLDDNSPDGTGQILESLTITNPNLYVIHREKRQGIGGAHKHGIAWAYEHGYNELITIDADFTHPPEQIPELLNNTDMYDVVVGSRYLKKNGLKGWNMIRKVLTWTAHILTTALLGLKYDSTGAFRLYRIDQIPKEIFDMIFSTGYSFFFESLYVININRYRIHEIPIALPPRTYGSSKMSYTEAAKSIKMLFELFLKTRLLQQNNKLFSKKFDKTISRV